MTVVKVGGSLFELPDLGPRLSSWLQTVADPEILLVPGGGRLADEVRRLDRQHQLGEETSHWLALRALTVGAEFLARLLPGAALVHDLEGRSRIEDGGWRIELHPPSSILHPPSSILHPPSSILSSGRVAVLDPFTFTKADEGRSGCLPHTWEVTSDSLAARVAFVGKARQLILLKSVDVPAELDWEEAGERGFVDRYFASSLRQDWNPIPLVHAINFRSWRR